MDWTLATHRTGAPRVRGDLRPARRNAGHLGDGLRRVGLLVGPEALGSLELSSHGEPVKLLAEATLTVVLFADASRIDLRALRREIACPRGCSGSGCR